MKHQRQRRSKKTTIMADAVRQFRVDLDEEFITLPPEMPWTREHFIAFADHLEIIVPGTVWRVAYHAALRAFYAGRTGFTWLMKQRDEPTEGFAVAVLDRTLSENIRDLFAFSLREFLNDNAILLDQPGVALGWWFNKLARAWQFDIVALVETETEARELATLYDQDAIYNFNTRKEITL